jgi:hypothetical protein
MNRAPVKKRYDLGAEDIRAAPRFVGELVEQELFHPLAAGSGRPEVVLGHQLTSRLHPPI